MTMGLLTLSHSAKGSTWEKHKYIKSVDGKYYYPDSYEGGRHLSSLKDLRYFMGKKDSDKNDKNTKNIKKIVNKPIKKETDQSNVSKQKKSSGSSKKAGSKKENKGLSEKTKNKKISEVSDSDVEELDKFIKSSGIATTAKYVGYKTKYRISRQKS